jgi:hypothetical protein
MSGLAIMMASPRSPSPRRRSPAVLPAPPGRTSAGRDAEPVARAPVTARTDCDRGSQADTEERIKSAQIEIREKRRRSLPGLPCAGADVERELHAGRRARHRPADAQNARRRGAAAHSTTRQVRSFAELAASGTRGHRRQAGLFAGPANSAGVLRILALSRTDAQGSDRRP